MIVKNKPKELKALKWKGDNEQEMRFFLRDLSDSWVAIEVGVSHILHIQLTDQHALRYYEIRPGNWLIKDHEGKLQICHDSKFLSNFEVLN